MFEQMAEYVTRINLILPFQSDNDCSCEGFDDIRLNLELNQL
jgi:hypothetical protein